MNIEDMTDRELVAGLMRGDRPSMKQGYSARSAVLTVKSLRYPGIESAGKWMEAEPTLQAFADGFALGMAEDREAIQPVRV